MTTNFNEKILSKSLALKEQQVFYLIPKNRPSYFAFKGGLFCFRYYHKGQVKYSPYTQYMGVFINSAKPLYVRVAAFLVNYYL